MADVKLGESFGLESTALAAIDWELALGSGLIARRAR
jgi:hypothetical protein